jgi:hypothetical protein
MTNACPSLDIYWEPRLRNLRNMGLSLRDQIRGLEEAGAPVEVLQAVIIHLYRPEPAWPHSHGRPYMESEATPEERLALCSWAVEVLRRPAAVIDRFGHNLLDIFAYRVACLPRERWFLGSIHDAFEGHPAFDGATMLAAIDAGLRFDSLFQSMDLTWIRKAVQGFLEIVDPTAPLRLPPSLRCLGRFEVRGARGFTRLQGIRVLGDHGTAIIENCPDLEELELPRANRVEVQHCAGLRRIRGRVPMGGLEVTDCPQLIEANLAFPKVTLARPGIIFRDCPSLVRLKSMSRIRRVIGDLTLTDCPSLKPPLPPLVVMGRMLILNAPFLMKGFADPAIVKASDAFTQKFIKEYNHPPDPYAAMAYIGIKEAVRGIELAQSTDPSAISKAIMAHPKFDSMKGPGVWRADHQPLFKYGAFVVEGKGEKERRNKDDLVKIIGVYTGEEYLPVLKDLGY